MYIKVILIIVIIVIVVDLIKQSRKSFDDEMAGVKMNTRSIEQSADQNAVLLAKKYVEAFDNGESVEKLNNLSADVIELARFYYAKYDFASYNCLLRAAEETSYIYRGNKYPHDLVEEIMRNQRV